MKRSVSILRYRGIVSATITRNAKLHAFFQDDGAGHKGLARDLGHLFNGFLCRQGLEPAIFTFEQNFSVLVAYDFITRTFIGPVGTNAGTFAGEFFKFMGSFEFSEQF